MARMAMLVLGVLILFAAIPSPVNAGSAADLSPSFYQFTCPQVKDIVFNTVFNYVKMPGPNHSLSLAPAMLRMHFHDCFVRGCDASVLLKNGTHAERDAQPNANSLRSFEVIDEIKRQLEIRCPKKVSCADTLALAAMYSVKLLGGPEWEVPLGRRDGSVSVEAEANAQIPSPFLTYIQLVAAFAAKGLSAKQMVVLSGAHTIGSGACAFVAPRLYNFTQTAAGGTDPSLDPYFASYLKAFCPKNPPTNLRLTMKPCGTDFPQSINQPRNNQTYTDGQGFGQGSGCNSTFDSYYFNNDKFKRGYFISDSALVNDPSGLPMVTAEAQYPNNQPFFTDFAAAMIAMSQISPLTKTEGSIHVTCSNPSG